MTQTPITVYGIAHCDTVKKARLWLETHKTPYQFHDLKKQGIEAAELATWIDALTWEALLNRRGTTWRGLDPVAQASVTDAPTAAALMLTHVSVIKRPVTCWPSPSGVRYSVGFQAQTWSEYLQHVPTA